MVAAGGVRRLPVERLAPEGTRYGQRLTRTQFARLDRLMRSKMENIENPRIRTSYFSVDLKSRCERLAVGPDWP